MKKILVVDDEFGLADALQALLVDEGYRVTTAVNGMQGLEKLGELKPDLVLLDYMMPVMSGPAMLKAMREEANYRATPVVLMSGVPESLLPADTNGHNGFLRKPFEATALLSIVKSLLAD